MPAYVLRRLALSVPVLLLASLLLFVFVRATFDPTARLAQSRDAGTVERERERLGLDEPVLVQYRDWLGNAVTGDLGESSRTNQPVREMIGPAFGTTMQLLLWGVVVSAAVAVTIGVYSALRQYSWADYAFTGLSYLAVAMPPFWFGLLAIDVLAVRSQRWFGLSESPVFFVGLHSVGRSGIDADYLRHLVLPVLTLTVQIIASWSRFQRAAMLEVLSSDFVRTARAKGLPRRAVVLRHGVRNALVPLVTVMAVDIGLLFGGLIITETIFSIPGMGRLFFQALQQGDVHVIEAWLIVVAGFVIVCNLVADVLYSILDPRIRLA